MNLKKKFHFPFISKCIIHAFPQNKIEAGWFYFTRQFLISAGFSGTLYVPIIRMSLYVTFNFMYSPL